MMRILCSLVRQLGAAAPLAIAFAAPLNVHGQEQHRNDPRAVALLPIYCKYTQGYSTYVPGGNNPEEIKRWYARLGPTFHAMHHYCNGLVASNKALLARDRQSRMHQLNVSINEFDYVIQRAPEDFVLLPEILTKKGESLIRRGEAGRGISELQRAIALKPDYWPPYAALSDYFRDDKDLARARDWLNKALAITPDVKALQLRLADLDTSKGGRKAVPVPYQDKVGRSPNKRAPDAPDTSPAPQAAEPQIPTSR